MNNSNSSKRTIGIFISKIFQYQNFLVLLGLIATISIAYFQNKKKELTFSIDTTISLIDDKNLSNSGLKVTIDDVVVSNLYKANCSITNTGNIGILGKDVLDTMFKIQIPNSIKIVKYEIFTIPKEIKLYHKISDEDIIVRHDLLNPDEKILINIYYTSNQNNTNPVMIGRLIDGQIVSFDKTMQVGQGNKLIIPLPAMLENGLIWYALILNTFMFFLMSYAILGNTNSDKVNTPANIIAFLILGTGFIASIFYIINSEFLK